MCAYCTTNAGVHLTTKIWSWQEKGYKSTEYVIFTPQENQPIVSIINILFLFIFIKNKISLIYKENLTNKEKHQLEEQNYKINRCMFVSLTKDMPSIVWEYIK